MVPCMDTLTCGSPRTSSPSALVVTELPAVARPAAAAVGGHGAERSAGSDRHFEQREIQAAGDAAALGAQEFGIADGQEVALEFDIEVVLDGQGKGILQREVEVSGADQIVDARASFRSVRRESCAAGQACSRSGLTARPADRKQRQEGAGRVLKHFRVLLLLAGRGFFRRGDGIDFDAFPNFVAGIDCEPLALLQTGEYFEAVAEIAAQLDAREM